MWWHLIYSYIILVLLAVYLFFKWKFGYWKNRGVPTTSTHFPFGTFRAKDPRHLKDILHEAYISFKNSSPIAGFYVAFSPIGVVLDLDFIKTMLIKDFYQFHDRQLYYNEEDDPLTAQLISLRGEKWRRLRAKFSPSFTPGKMKMIFPTIVDIAEHFVKALDEDLKLGPEVEMKEYLARYATDAIGRCGFGIECNSLKDANAEFRKYGRSVFDKPRHGQFVFHLSRQFPKVAKFFKIRLFTDDVIDFFMKVVRETVTFREENNVKVNDFMDSLIDLKNGPEGLTMNEVTAQAFIFFLGGYESTATAMMYCLYELSINQEIQNKARKEVYDVLEKYNGQLTYDGSIEMRYVNQIISETLRKYPSIPFLVRSTEENYQVPNSKIVLEKGTKIFVPIYSIQHDPEIYPDPEKFDPDRFNPDEETKRHPMSYLPFGDGPRNCIGLRFGSLQFRVGLITLLKNYTMELSPRTKLPFELDKELIFLAIKGSMYLNMRKIQKDCC